MLRHTLSAFLGRWRRQRPGTNGFHGTGTKDAQLLDLVRRVTAGRSVVLASNRGPVEFILREGESLKPARGSGGVVTILSALAKVAPLTWIACPMGEGDRIMAESSSDGRIPSDLPEYQLQLRFVLPSKEAYEKYYNAFSNPLLWCLQHCIWDLTYAPIINAAVYDAWESGYQAVNEAFADVIVKELAETTSRPLVFIHDYHLYLVAGYVRQRLPQAILQHFIHIPWPDARYWLLLPPFMRAAILESLCQNDIVGFQTHRDALNFLYTCAAYLEEASVNHAALTVTLRDRMVRVRVYPVSIDAEDLRAVVASQEAQEYLAQFRSSENMQTIVRVDRLEPTKNILRGFMAYDGLLSRYPELAGKVRFLAFLVPSRTDLKLYQQYADEVFELVKQINERHGNNAWKPIQVFYENNFVQAIAAMTQYDVLLVNSLVDGMNLVAKEGATVNSRNGVLILSEGAGAHEQLGPYALSVAPADVEGTIYALYSALTMPEAQRAHMAARLREEVAAHDLSNWLTQQLQDILELQMS